jgi:hypothetical protein
VTPLPRASWKRSAKGGQTAPLWPREPGAQEAPADEVAALGLPVMPLLIDHFDVRRLLLVGLALGACPLSVGLADCPELQPPEPVQEIWSRDGSYCAVIDADAHVTTVFQVDAKKARIPLWQMDEAVKEGWLSEGGRALVATVEGCGDVRSRYDAAAPALRYYEWGKPPRTLAMRDLFPKEPPQKATQPDFKWGGVSVIVQEEGDVLLVGMERSHFWEDLAAAGPAERTKMLERLAKGNGSGLFERVVRLRLYDGKLQDKASDKPGDLLEPFKPQRPCRSLSVIDSPDSPVPHL